MKLLKHAPLVALSVLVAACGGTYRPLSRMGVRGERVAITVDAVHVDAGGSAVDITVVNRGDRPLAIRPSRAVLHDARLGDTEAEPERDSGLVEGVAGAVAAGAEIGGQLSTGSGSGSRSTAGAQVAGGAAGLVLALPVAAIMLAVEAANREPHALAPGARRSFSLPFATRIDEQLVLLDLASAVEGVEPSDVERLRAVPVVDLSHPHRGYGPNERSRVIWGLGLGGGAIVDTANGAVRGTVGLELLRFGVSINGVVDLILIGAGPYNPSAGAEVRVRHRFDASTSLAPFVRYDLTYLSSEETVWHVGRLGAALEWTLGTRRQFGRDEPPGRWGFTLAAGPAYQPDDRLLGVQVMLAAEVVGLL